MSPKKSEVLSASEILTVLIKKFSLPVASAWGKASLKLEEIWLVTRASNGIQGFNPADLGGSIGSVLGSITAANPLIAGALALGGLAASQILGGMSKTTESAKQTGREIYQAMLDGVIEMKEREGIVAKAMGVEDFTAAQAAIADIAAKMGVPAADLQAQFLGLGEVTMPTVEAAMVKVREQIQQGVLASDPMAGKYTDAYDAAVAVSGTMGKITTQWGIQGGAIANNTSAVKKLNAALLVQEQTMIRIGYGPGSATYRSQVPAYTTGTRSPTS